MIGTPARRAARLAPLAAALAIAVVGVAACGSDDGADGSNGQTASGDEQEIKAVYAKMTDSVYAGKSKVACTTMSRSAAREFGASFTNSTGGGDVANGCEAAMDYVHETIRNNNRPRIVRLKIDGDRATAYAKTKNSDAYPIPFVKEDGEWRINGGYR